MCHHRFMWGHTLTTTQPMITWSLVERQGWPSRKATSFRLSTERIPTGGRWAFSHFFPLCFCHWRSQEQKRFQDLTRNWALIRARHVMWWVVLPDWFPVSSWRRRGKLSSLETLMDQVGQCKHFLLVFCINTVLSLELKLKSPVSVFSNAGGEKVNWLNVCQLVRLQNSVTSLLLLPQETDLWWKCLGSQWFQHSENGPCLPPFDQMP